MTLSRAVRAVLILLVILTAAMLYPPLRLTALVLAGRSPVCPWANAVKAESNPKELIAAKDRILAASKVIATDGIY